MSSTELFLMLLLFVAMVPLVGIMAALMPWLMKGRECFAVTVPETAQSDSRLRRFKLRYTAIMLALTALASLAGGICLAFDAKRALFISVVAGAPLLVAASFLLMLHFRRKVTLVKRQEGWEARVQEQVAVNLGCDAPRPLSLRWSILYLAIIVFTLAIGIIGYPAMPDLVPLHADLAGNIDRWEPKSPAVVAFPLVMQLFLAGSFMLAHWTILRSKKGADPESPVTSALAYALFARAQSVFVVASGTLLELVMVLFPLSSLGIVTLGQAAIGVVLGIVPILAGSIALAIIYGQSGARAIRRIRHADELRFDDDAFWKLGVLYWNAQDASLFVPERFGIGWTMNLARPASWAIIAGLCILTIGLIVATALMF